MYEGVLNGRQVKMTNKFYEQVMAYLNVEKLEDYDGLFRIDVPAQFCIDRSHACHGCPLNFAKDEDDGTCFRLMQDILGTKAYKKMDADTERLDVNDVTFKTAQKYVTQLRDAFSGLRKV